MSRCSIVTLLVVAMLSVSLLSSCSSSVGSDEEGWNRVENSVWTDRMGNQVRLQGSGVVWSNDAGKTWQQSNGAWQAADGRWYMLDAARSLLSSNLPQGEWQKDADQIWPGINGVTYKFGKSGTLVQKP